jgi:hypothetical protein
MHTSRRVNDLKNELEFVFSNNFTASDHLSDEITSQPRDTVAKILFFDWVLLDVPLWLNSGQPVLDLRSARLNCITPLKIYRTTKPEVLRTAPEKLLEETIDTNWKRFNTFVDINMRLLNKVFKEFLSLIERDRDNVAAGSFKSECRLF